MKFKHNDRVTCEIGGTKITDARISINEDGRPFICQNKKAGIATDDLLGYTYSWWLKKDFTESTVKNLRLVEKTFDNPQIGDEYKDKYGDSRFVLGVAGRIIFLSGSGGKNAYGYGTTKEQLIKFNYTIVQDEAEEVPEVTMDEVCEKFGKEVKIKK